jgi:hypothetical protein
MLLAVTKDKPLLFAVIVDTHVYLMARVSRLQVRTHQYSSSLSCASSHRLLILKSLLPLSQMEGKQAD